jgi:hypothetical protein
MPAHGYGRGGPAGLAAAAVVTALLLTSCSKGTGQELASSLQDAAAAAASVDLSLGQIQDGRSTRAASATLVQNMRDKVIEARDSASALSADTAQEREERADALATLDAVLRGVLSAKDAVSDGDMGGMPGLRASLQHLTVQARAQAAAMKGSRE